MKKIWISHFFSIGFSSWSSEGDVFSKFSHLTVEETNEVRNGLSVRVSVESSLLVIISGLIAFSSTVISLSGLVFSSLISVILWGLSGSNSVIKGGDFSFKVGNIAIVFVDILLEESNILVEGTNSVVFGLSFKVEGLVHLVLEVFNKLNNLSGEFLVGELLVSAGELSKHLDGFTVVDGMDEVGELSGGWAKDLFNLSHNLTVVNFSVLDEGNEVFIEDSSGFRESSSYVLILLALLFKGIGFTAT